MDVEGGWFDAGDYVKFTGTTSFTVALMLTAVRDHPALFDAGGGPAFRAEARRGVAWLLKMWNDQRRVLYYQVGIGSGNAEIQADHDVWRLPQKDDGMQQHARRYLAHRPVFRSGPPGSRVTPSLAGRVAAVFGLCAQVWGGTPLAARCLRSGQHLFDLAKTARVGTQVTSSPVDYYEEDEWRDDLEFGATELYRGLTEPSAPAPIPAHDQARYYLKQAATWAHAYLHSPEDDDTLNLYDTSGLAHGELIDAIAAGGAGGLAVIARTAPRGSPRASSRRAPPRRRPTRSGSAPARGIPRRTPSAWSRRPSRTTARPGPRRYAALARRQLDWTLGANAWGSSFVVGAGSTFPHCMQHQIANLVGSLDGTPPLLLGVDGRRPQHVHPRQGLLRQRGRVPVGRGEPVQAVRLEVGGGTWTGSRRGPRSSPPSTTPCCRSWRSRRWR